MKNIQTSACTLLLSLILMSCAARANAVTAASEQLARETLADFLDSLQAGEYAQAARLYGGSYETMIDHNPDIDPDDRAALLKRACTLNGMECLRVNSITPDTRSAGPDFVFQVEFRQDDGTLFVLEACCGGDAPDSPPQSVFTFRVRVDAQGKFVVLDTPPYAP